MIRSRAILIYNITYSLLPQILFLRAICEAYTFSSNRTRGKARNALQSIPPARETDSSKRLFPLSFLFLLSLLFDAFRFERESIEKTSNVKEIHVLSKIVCVREKERESIETQSNISHLALRLPLYNCKAALRRKLRKKNQREERKARVRMCVRM